MKKFQFKKIRSRAKHVAMKHLKTFAFFFTAKKETLEVYILEVSYDCSHQLY